MKLVRANMIGIACANGCAALCAWWTSPHGFRVGGRAFVEHEVVAVLYIAISAILLWALWTSHKILQLAVASLLMFWVTVSAVALTVGTTVFSARAGIVGAFALVSLLVITVFQWRVPRARVMLLAGSMLGVLHGSAFLFSTWAPVAGTHPVDVSWSSRATIPGPPILSSPKVLVTAHESRVDIQSGTDVLRVMVAPDFDGVSPSGFWSLFDYEHPAWNFFSPVRLEGPVVQLAGVAKGMRFRALVSVHDDLIHIVCQTHLDTAIAAHLSLFLAIILPSPLRVNGVLWHESESAREFIAIRNHRVELLRAAHEEKGPFRTLGSWSETDPVIEGGRWRIHVHGWLAQGAHDESPTAGWNVSQAAIERVGDSLLWELSATSVGRGWNTVRTAQGDYLLDVEVHTLP